MKADITTSALFCEADQLHRAMQNSKLSPVCEAADLHVNARQAFFTGVLSEVVEGLPQTRIFRSDLDRKVTIQVSAGPRSDRRPKVSPDGATLAYLSDQRSAGDFQLCVMDLAANVVCDVPDVEGWVEDLRWSPDGTRILLGVAGHGAHMAAGQGSSRSISKDSGQPEWMPDVDTGDEAYRWRRPWIWDRCSNTHSHDDFGSLNYWEIDWLGNTSIIAVASENPDEGSWYDAALVRVNLSDGHSKQLYRSHKQLGHIAGSPGGRWIAFVEATCSDRGIVAGDLKILCDGRETPELIDTRSIDIAFTAWVSDSELLVAGHRGSQTVVGIFDARNNNFRECWASNSITAPGRYAAVSPLDRVGDFALIGIGFDMAPELAEIRGGEYRRVMSFDAGYAAAAEVIAAIEDVKWAAPDGLEIQGWLLSPHGSGPFPLITYLHGGPIFHWRPMLLSKANMFVLMLLKHGFAVFLPNPRGSSGRGQTFAEAVLGDIGGGDARDILAGIDMLVDRGVADPTRLGLTGASYGGFMTAWLISQDRRFSAAIPVVPHTNQVTQHLLSNIPQFMSRFTGGSLADLQSRYYSRSPILFASHVVTPVLNICGREDLCTPPEEAAQFHSALREQGVRSILVTYPQEGHGVLRYPAVVDYSARVCEWFLRHLV